MARNKALQANIDNTNPARYPNGRIKNSTGSGDGTPVNEQVYGDIHELMAKVMRLYNIPYNNQPDNENNGYQLVEAFRALASKNDFVLALTSVGGVLQVPLKIAQLTENESFILKAAVDRGSETEITGNLVAGDSVKTVSIVGDFKTNEYVRMINTGASVILIRLIDSINLQTAAVDLGFLSKATQTEQDAGLIDTKATTPLTNKATFAKRVNGADSGSYLAIETSQGATARNGLMTAAEKQAIIDFNLGNIVIDSQTNVVVGSWTDNFDGSDDFTRNFVDVAPPSGKTIGDLKGFMASHSRLRYDGTVNDDDKSWCQWRLEPVVNPTKIRVICGSTELREPPRVNYIAIWI